MSLKVGSDDRGVGVMGEVRCRRGMKRLMIDGWKFEREVRERC